MRKILSLITSSVILISSISTVTAAVNTAPNLNTKNKTLSVPVILGKSAILIDSKSGQILYEKASNEKHFPASTTKVMTALLSIENLKPDTVITASTKACTIPGDSSSAGIMSGEKLTVTNLLYSLLLDSATEAANILGEKISGSTQSFANLMTKRAKELGAKGTNFVNTNGYDDPNHYTTAYDLSRIAMQAMKYPLFRKIVSTSVYKVPPTNKHPKGIYLSNTNKLVNKVRGSMYFYPYAIGIKTGSTSLAKHTLVSAARKGNIELISVVLYSDNTFDDTIKLFNYGLNNFKSMNLTKKDAIISTVNLVHGSTPLKICASKELNYLVPNDSNVTPVLKLSYKKALTAPLKKNTILGTANYSINNKIVASTPVYSMNSVKNLKIIKEQNLKKLFRIVIILVALLVAVSIFIIIKIKRKKKRLYRH
jgi:D-alanyl-D-alanine carboxypeptidase (penicillin-binding protein 5/6)